MKIFLSDKKKRVTLLQCYHSDDRREEESRKHLVNVTEILRFALDDMMVEINKQYLWKQV